METKERKKELSIAQIKQAIKSLESHWLYKTFDIHREQLRKLREKYPYEPTKPGNISLKEFISHPDCPDNDYGKRTHNFVQLGHTKNLKLKFYKRLLKKKYFLNWKEKQIKAGLWRELSDRERAERKVKRFRPKGKFLKTKII